MIQRSTGNIALRLATSAAAASRTVRPPGPPQAQRMQQAT
jgi:hypothetical protein